MTMTTTTMIIFTKMSIFFADSPWFLFNQSYFQLVDTKVTFEEARKACLQMKGDLASPSSEEEQNYLFKTFLETKDGGEL